MKQSIRIIGGRYKGKKLQVPNNKDLRPTPNRVRETLFNWLMHDIHSMCCLDAFSGSGALGFEAFSRGALEVTLLEKERHPYVNLKKQAQEFNATNLWVINQDACEFIEATHKTFDLIFLDPPFQSNLLKQSIALIQEKKLLNPSGLLYIEASNDYLPEATNWETLKRKTAGQVTYGLYRHISSLTN